MYDLLFFSLCIHTYKYTYIYPLVDWTADKGIRLYFLYKSMYDLLSFRYLNVTFFLTLSLSTLYSLYYMYTALFLYVSMFYLSLISLSLSHSHTHTHTLQSLSLIYI